MGNESSSLPLTYYSSHITVSLFLFTSSSFLPQDDCFSTWRRMAAEVKVGMIGTDETTLFNRFERRYKMTTAVVKVKSTHPLAVIALVLAVLGLMPVLPVIGSIAGLVTGMIARSNIARSPEQYSGDGLAKAAIVLGVIGVALAVLVVIGAVLFLMPLTVNLGV
jgi:hypothetical protein